MTAKVLIVPRANDPQKYDVYNFPLDTNDHFHSWIDKPYKYENNRFHEASADAISRQQLAWVTKVDPQLVRSAGKPLWAYTRGIRSLSSISEQSILEFGRATGIELSEQARNNPELIGQIIGHYNDIQDKTLAPDPRRKAMKALSEYPLLASIQTPWALVRILIHIAQQKDNPIDVRLSAVKAASLDYNVPMTSLHAELSKSQRDDQVLVRLDELVELAKDPNPLMQEQVVQTLDQFSYLRWSRKFDKVSVNYDQEIEDRLSKLYSETSSETLRLSIIKVAGGSSRMLATLLQASREKSVEFRLATVEALAGFIHSDPKHRSEAIAILQNLSQDSDPRVQKAALTIQVELELADSKYSFQILSD